MPLDQYNIKLDARTRRPRPLSSLSMLRHRTKGQTGKRTVFLADRIPGRNTNLDIPIVSTVDVHPQDILARPDIEDDFGPFDDAVGSQVAAARARQQRAYVVPLHQVRRGVAVDVQEGRAAALVFADDVVSPIVVDHPGPVGTISQTLDPWNPDLR